MNANLDVVADAIEQAMAGLSFDEPAAPEAAPAPVTRKMSNERVTVETTLTDHEAFEIVRDGMTSDFAKSLVEKYRKGWIRHNGIVWLHKLALEQLARDMAGMGGFAEEAADVPTLPKLMAFLRAALPKYKTGPEIVVPMGEKAGGKAVRIKLCTSGKWAGTTWITDDGQYPSRKVYGKIPPGSDAFESRHPVPEVAEILRLIDVEPATYLARVGRMTGDCCYCGQKLTDDNSLHWGYGPVCAKKWELPHGKPKPQPGV